MTLRQTPFRTGMSAFSCASTVAHITTVMLIIPEHCVYMRGENVNKKWLYAACTHLRTSRLKPEDRYFICMPHFMRICNQTRSEEGCVHCCLSQAWIHPIHRSGAVCEHLGLSTSMRKTDLRKDACVSGPKCFRTPT